MLTPYMGTSVPAFKVRRDCLDGRDVVACVHCINHAGLKFRRWRLVHQVRGLATQSGARGRHVLRGPRCAVLHLAQPRLADSDQFGEGRLCDSEFASPSLDPCSDSQVNVGSLTFRIGFANIWLMDDINTVIGLRVRIARKAKGLTLCQLAGKVGCSQPHLSRLEQGHETWSAARLSAVAAVVGVPVDLLCPVRAHEPAPKPVERAAS